MGGSNSSIAVRIENAQKFGICSLSELKLKKVPEEILKTKLKLRTLDLSKNQIVCLPGPIIGQLSLLKNINVANNQIDELSSAICKLTKLEKIDLSYNRIRQLPNEFNQLRSLKILLLTNNHMTTFPVAIAELCQLDMIDLSYNNIKELPSDLTSLNAVELNLNNNLVTVLPASIANCSRLKVLRIQNNSLTLDSIPLKLLTESNVSLLAVEGNSFPMKQFQDTDGYDKYMERYTAAKKKIG